VIYTQLGAEMEILTKNSYLNSILLKAFSLCKMSPANRLGNVESYGYNC